jgi:hypothetical protein
MVIIASVILGVLVFRSVGTHVPPEMVRTLMPNAAPVNGHLIISVPPNIQTVPEGLVPLP